ncbi:MAG TPA: DNA repair protein RecO [Kiritimatiellia bacterium]|nr:DNA repair protein RecO [Kiritimatiellia bacterium]
MSRLTKTRAIVVRHAPLTESSRVIQWVTEDHGKLVTLAKGAMRPRHGMLGQFDHLYTCELLYYAREADAVYITREIAPITLRTRFRQDWRAALAGAYLADLTARVMPQHEPAPELFRLMESGLDELQERGWYAPMLFLYELRLLDRLGLTPKLDRCAACDQAFKPSRRAAFSSRRGGMICDACKGEPSDHAVGADVPAMMAFWRKSPDWTVVRASRPTAAQLAAVRTLNGDFLGYHLDLRAGARERTLDLLS